MSSDSSSLNPNLVNLFATKPHTLTWTVDLNSREYQFKSPSFGNNDIQFLLHLFKNSEIWYLGNSNECKNVNIYNKTYFDSRYPDIFFLNYTNKKYPAKVFTRISILNAKGEKCDTQEGRVNFNKSSYYGLYFTSSGGVFHFNFNDHLIDNQLTIYCEVYILNDEQCLSEGFNAAALIAASNDHQALLDSGKFSDFVISVGGKEFKAHKIILAARSPVFAVMFEHTDTKEALEGRVEIEDVQSEVFEQFERGIPQVPVHGKGFSFGAICSGFVGTGREVSSLKSLCAQQLSSTLTTESLGKLLYLADLYRSDELKSNCAQFIKYFPDKIDWDAVKSVMNDCSKELGFELLKFSNTKQ